MDGLAEDDLLAEEDDLLSELKPLTKARPFQKVDKEQLEELIQQGVQVETPKVSCHIFMGC